MLAGLTVPRFDSLGPALANVVGVALFLFAFSMLIRHRRDEYPPRISWWFVCIASLYFNGIYLPIGPLLVLNAFRRLQRRLDALSRPPSLDTD